ncbi:hypothetical protein EUGRSUZ_E02300 [Eucalyptus grandis]|uniref:Uncharacterized protein n=2 Tax=Eucalyptus grandis TaxID=71139 RepID=A0A059C5E0_EUCGR|nr:hypothetical protein EUGRSUZ_E02300 [Eucalyptus grandis]
MQRVAELVKAVASMTTKGASGMTTLCCSKSVFSMAEEVPKRLVIKGFKVLLFGVPKYFLGGTWGMASTAIFILKVIVNFFFILKVIINFFFILKVIINFKFGGWLLPLSLF